MLQLKGRRYDTGEPVCVSVDGTRIASVDPAWPAGAAEDWPYIAPGLFDLQVNGYGGVWFSNTALTPAQVIEAIRPYFSFGVTRLFPTLVTNSFEGLAKGFAAIRTACESAPWVNRMVIGCHLEGPYISSEDGPRGAHPKQHVRAADWNEFCKLQEISGNRIRLVTIAAEVPNAVEFIRKAVASKVTIAIGHTAANSEQIEAAVDAGARLSTHLGNGAHGTIRRHPNYIWDQLGESRLTASLITDGCHLPPGVIRSMVRGKSPQQTVITCDATGWAGCKPGRYENELGKVDVLEDGRVVVAGQDQILAGSGSGTDTCVVRMMEATGLGLRDAIDMACRNPTRLVGFDEISLRRGSQADLFLFRYPAANGRFDVLATLSAGELQFGSLPDR